MKRITCLLVALLYLSGGYAQKPAVISELLSAKQADELFPEALKKKLNIIFPVFRIYKYEDKSGKYYCVLTESRDSITEEKDTLNDKVAAINFRYENGNFVKTWEINDFIIKDHHETSIWFLTKYAEFKDFDGDGLAEPFIVYGTTGRDSEYEARIKFIIYYKGKKHAVRHQLSSLDYGRSSQVDKSVYTLPKSILDSIKQKMELMKKTRGAIFTVDWEKDFEKKKTNMDNL